MPKLTRDAVAKMNAQDLVFDFSTRAQNAFTAAGAQTIAQVLDLGQHGLQRIGGCGTKTVDEIAAVLLKFGFTLESGCTPECQRTTPHRRNGSICRAQLRKRS